MDTQNVVVTVVGDGSVGKTCLVQRFIGQGFSDSYVPTVLEEAHKSFGNYNLLIKDTAGQEEYARLRTLAYPGTDVFVVCFSLTNLNSYQNVKAQWFEELCHHKPNTPLVLVGTKFDDVGKRNVSHQDGLKLQKALRAEFYVECSAKEGTNIKEVFDYAIKAHLSADNKRRRRNNCCVL